MKKIFFLTLSILILASCSSGGSSASGETAAEQSGAPLGSVPALYHQASELRKEAKEEIKNLDGRDSNYPQKVQQIEERTKEKQQKLYEEAAQDAESLIGNAVPFEAGMVPAPFEVVNVIIEEYNGKGCFTARVPIRATADFVTVLYPNQVTDNNQVPMVDTYLYYVVMAKDNRGVSLGKINPFSTLPAFGISHTNHFLFEPGNSVQAEEMINEEGAPIAINCDMYDLTDFEYIKFITANDYRNLGGQ